jgi:hypothetical protein
MLGRGEHSRCWTYFGDATGVQDQQAICEACEQSGIVGDQDYGEAKGLPKGFEELQDFLLRCGIERRGRFIGNEEGRPQVIACAISTLWRWPPLSSWG